MRASEAFFLGMVDELEKVAAGGPGLRGLGFGPKLRAAQEHRLHHPGLLVRGKPVTGGKKRIAYRKELAEMRMGALPKDVRAKIAPILEKHPSLFGRLLKPYEGAEGSEFTELLRSGKGGRHVRPIPGGKSMKRALGPKGLALLSEARKARL